MIALISMHTLQAEISGDEVCVFQVTQAGYKPEIDVNPEIVLQGVEAEVFSRAMGDDQPLVFKGKVSDRPIQLDDPLSAAYVIVRAKNN